MTRRAATTAEYIPTEEQEQRWLFAWAEWESINVPELALLYAIPNGGYRHPKTAKAMKETGAKAGILDTCLPVARGGYHGAYVELKRTKGGSVSREQKRWIARLTEQGYYTAVCKGCDAAQVELLAYLNGERVRDTAVGLGEMRGAND